ncbi:hypothetical protein GOP47_0002417 [Adiantum capillus-veneris]|uniref:Uncharacterized protein n=1 Tax=Adiantum capillus-veneris TaxID=13818 RepID=A0A9D4ZP65_ADICA|nr:hypothetical protein GOP47_0002417 [Adiantum capillus-veneris]
MSEIYVERQEIKAQGRTHGFYLFSFLTSLDPVLRPRLSSSLRDRSTTALSPHTPATSRLSLLDSACISGSIQAGSSISHQGSTTDCPCSETQLL